MHALRFHLEQTNHVQLYDPVDILLPSFTSFFLFFNSEARSNQTITMSQVGHHPDSFVQEPDPAYLCPIW